MVPIPTKLDRLKAWHWYIGLMHLFLGCYTSCCQYCFHHGPYYLCQRLSDVLFKVKRNSDNEIIKTPVHVNKLKFAWARHLHCPKNEEKPMCHDAGTAPVAPDDLPTDSYNNNNNNNNNKSLYSAGLCMKCIHRAEHMTDDRLKSVSSHFCSSASIS